MFGFLTNFFQLKSELQFLRKLTILIFLMSIVHLFIIVNLEPLFLVFIYKWQFGATSITNNLYICFSTYVQTWWIRNRLVKAYICARMQPIIEYLVGHRTRLARFTSRNYEGDIQMSIFSHLTCGGWTFIDGSILLLSKVESGM